MDEVHGFWRCWKVNLQGCRAELERQLRVLLAGATGTIGQAVLAELLARDFEVVALAREAARNLPATHDRLTVWQGDWIHPSEDMLPPGGFDAVISCIASRTGGLLDAWYVDYFANLRLLDMARRTDAQRFVLLSAICVQKPQLVFQREKLRFEAALAASGLGYTIIRPTAYFKSLAGQFERVKRGKPFLVFGDGLLTACKPVSERDLASYLVNRMLDADAAGQILPIGGPGRAITPMDQVSMLGRVLGREIPVRSVSPQLFDVLGVAIAPAGWVSQWGLDRREFLRIAKYYATESMLVWDEARGCYDPDLTPETGSDSLEGFYEGLRDGVVSLPDRRGASLF